MARRAASSSPCLNVDAALREALEMTLLVAVRATVFIFIAVTVRWILGSGADESTKSSKKGNGRDERAQSGEDDRGDERGYVNGERE
jgi:hypothetical protein